MSFMIAAAGTGGHVYPGLAVGEALVAAGVDRDQVVYVGGDRIESTVYPAEGFGFLQLELRGLRRSLSPANLSIPQMVLRARRRVVDEISARGVRAVLGMGGYVTVPTAMAARKAGVALFVAEQNAHAGLANRVAARWAKRVFVSFPRTEGLPAGEWVGNPVRESLAGFDRPSLRPVAMARYDLDPDIPVLGVFGGSLGAMAINDAVAGMLAGWQGSDLQVIHLVGESNLDRFSGLDAAPQVRWVRLGFEEEMDKFFAASDLVVARAGGSVAEITATATPSVLIPGSFGSSGHQAANADYLVRAGAALVVEQTAIDDLPAVVSSLVGDGERLAAMAAASRSIARRDAAKVVAQAMIEAAR